MVMRCKVEVSLIGVRVQIGRKAFWDKEYCQGQSLKVVYYHTEKLGETQ